MRLNCQLEQSINYSWELKIQMWHNSQLIKWCGSAIRYVVLHRRQQQITNSSGLHRKHRSDIYIKKKPLGLALKSTNCSSGVKQATKSVYQ